MVRDPSVVLTGVFIGGGHNKHGAGSRCTLPKQCRPPSPRRRWRCDRSSYKRSLFSRIRDSQMHYLTGPETTVRQHPVTVSDLCGVEPLRDGQAHQFSFRISGCFITTRQRSFTTRARSLLFSVYVALTNIPEGELLTGFAMRSDPNVAFG